MYIHMYIYIYIYIYIVIKKDLRDFEDTVYPFFESDTLWLECLFVSVS